jgi:hypothetical protein
MRQHFLSLSVRVFLLASCCFVLSFSFLPPASAQGTRPEQASHGYRGQTAINRLGTRLAAVAARYKKSTSELAALLRNDHTLWVDKSDNLVFLEEEVAAPSSSANDQAAAPSTEALAAPMPYDQTLLLHSLPGATKVIYLDFDGHTTSGTQWNKNYNNPSATTWGNDIVSVPFDMDSVAGFSNAELDFIQYVWQRVAEDFAPFNVDVTTQDPGIENLRYTGSADTAWGMRVVISATSSFYASGGGAAYPTSYNWNVTSTNPAYVNNQLVTHTPCFVFPNRLGPNNEKMVAEAVSHEAGHTLGLYHDGTWDGTTFNAYYQGQNGWAPIMGLSYYQSLTQWSKGEYPNAQNRDSYNAVIPLQDDLAVMTTGYGITFRNDDYANSTTGAASLGTGLTGKGVIETATDVDYFSFTNSSGGNSSYSFNITGNPRDPNLDIQVKLFDGYGTLINTYNPAGVSVNFSTTLSTGNYYLAIEGVGTGDPLQGYYSDYASLGEYNISGAVAAPPAAPGGLTATAASSSQINLSWTDASNNESGFKIERSLNNSTWTAVTTVGQNVTSYSNTGLTAGTLYYYRVRATNASGDSANSNVASATTSAAAQSSVTMHVGAITSTKATSKTGWTATATITMHKSSDALLASATVTGTWSNGATGTTTCKTSTKGVCSISKSGNATTTASVTFTVTNVTLSGYTYDAVSNHNPTGGSVVITKP